MIILGLGCNIGDRLLNLRKAYALLRVLPELQILKVSPVYASDALLEENADPAWNMPYLNLAIGCVTSLAPEELLSKLKAIEKKLGRVKYLHWSPRVIDIDILAWDEQVINNLNLHIPHSGLIERPFALWPLADIAPDWKYCEPNTAVTGVSAQVLVQRWGSRFDGKSPLHTRQIAHRIDTPQMMGILNVTPDSFSDGGSFYSVAKALQQAEELFNAGADIIDIGAESTRPHAQVLVWQEEWSRLEPILEAINANWPKNSFRPKLSVDTRNADTARLALSYDIDFLNDVSGFTSQSMQMVAAQSAVQLIYMHNLGVPPAAQNILDVSISAVSQVYAWGEKQRDSLLQLGVKAERLIFDPGIGFGKSAAQSFELITKADEFAKLQLPILFGHSRKSFLSLFAAQPFTDRDYETAAFSAYLAQKNVSYLRVHNVAANMRIMKILRQLMYE